MKASNIPLLILILTLFIYIFYRAGSVSMTHDECNTINIVENNHLSSFYETANNHLLNTWLIKKTIQISGSKSETTLRFPNILAFLIYGTAVLLIVNLKKSNVLMQLTGGGLLLLNPYLIDFFSLARGYGLALAFGLMSIYFLLRKRDPNDFNIYLIHLFFAMLFSMLASYSNFIFINLNIALLGIFMLELPSFINKNNLQKNWSVSIAFLITISLNFYHLRYVYDSLMRLQTNNELYLGGGGIIDTTLRILIQRSIYLSYYGEAFWINILNGLVIIFFLLNVILLYRKRFDELTKAFVLLFLIVASAVLQFHMFRIPFPMERTSLIFIPLICLVIYLSINELYTISSKLKPWLGHIVSVLFFLTLFVPLSYHFYKSLNKHYVVEYKFDANTKIAVEKMKEIIQKQTETSENTQLSCSWEFKPSLNFYINAESIHNLNFTPDNDFKNGADFIYCKRDDTLNLNILENYKLIAEFKDTRSLLLQKN